MPRPPPVIVQVIDTCQECQEDELQLHAAALAQLESSLQPVPKSPLGVRYQQVSAFGHDISLSINTLDWYQ